MAGAFAHIRVLDASETIGGQYCARLFADLGAEVLLIEPPGGSALRRQGPFRDGELQLFFHLNTSKRSVALDLGSATDRSTFDQLVATSDVVMLPPGIDPLEIERINPAAVVATVSAFGADGPLQHWQGPEIVLQALSGMMNNNGSPGREPLYGVGNRAAYAAGLGAHIGISAALYERETSGKGQRVSVDAAETAAAMCFPYVMQHIYNGAIRTRGNFDTPAGQVLCRDGWVCIWIYNHRWSALCGVLGLKEIENDPRFSVTRERLKHWDELFAIIQDTVKDRLAEDLVADLQGAEIISAKAYRPHELHHTRQLAARNYWQSVEGRRVVGPPFRLSRTPIAVRSLAPELDEAAGDFAERQPRRAGART